MPRGTFVVSSLPHRNEELKVGYLGGAFNCFKHADVRIASRLPASHPTFGVIEAEEIRNIRPFAGPCPSPLLGMRGVC